MGSIYATQQKCTEYILAAARKILCCFKMKDRQTILPTTTEQRKQNIPATYTDNPYEWLFINKLTPADLAKTNATKEQMEAYTEKYKVFAEYNRCKWLITTIHNGEIYDRTYTGNVLECRTKLFQMMVQKDKNVELTEPHIERQDPSGLYTLSVSADVLGSKMDCYARPFETVR